MDAVTDPVRPAPGGGTLIDVWVVPGSSRPGLDGVHDGRVRVRVAAPPEAGRANREAAAAVASVCGVRRARVVAGESARRKVIEVPGTRPAEVLAALQQHGVST